MVVAHQSSSDEIGILRKIFRKYDARGDGSIRLEDFCQAFGNVGCAGGVEEEDWEDVFEAMVGISFFASLCFLYLLIAPF